MSQVFSELEPGAPSGLRPSQRADFQVDGILALARDRGVPPRQMAHEVLERATELGLMDICERAEVAGPGFVNLYVSAGFLGEQVRACLAGEELLGPGQAARPLKVVVDYGGPNAAKQMHVGHLRSTIIGDAIVRLLEACGHDVVRQNHVGDWGAPFGMLIEHLVDLGEVGGAHELGVGDLEGFYQGARAAYDNEPGFAERARARVVKLQSGDAETLKLWEALVDRSISHFQEAFTRLGTKLSRQDVVGESHYNPLLPGLVADLAAAGLLVESEGALCVFPPGHTNREGAPLPLIIRNSVGGYTYAATDLAALRDRTGRLGADLVVYVVGLPQAEHLKMVFATARLAGWLRDDQDAVHVGFGNVLGPDGKMFRTRQGGSVKLAELLDEAVQQARAVLTARGAQSGQAEQGDLDAIARAVGIGSVKYADLSTDRTRDYRFEWSRMLSFDGNTAPYIQYAHARIASIFRRASDEAAGGPGEGAAQWPPDAGCVARMAGVATTEALWTSMAPLSAPQESELAKVLFGFADAVEASVASYSPHKLCAYLFELANTFTSFYENCSVLGAPLPQRATRLGLAALTGRALGQGLAMLGIEAPERM